MQSQPVTAGELWLQDEQATEQLGGRCAETMKSGGIVYLSGELGMGKTTFCRGLLRRLGHRGAVKSPTFTLLESYRLASCEVFHFDLYRLADAEELEFIGLRDYLATGGLCLFEWPERGAGVLPAPDLVIGLTQSVQGRLLHWQAFSAVGQRMATAIESPRHS